MFIARSPEMFSSISSRGSRWRLFLFSYAIQALAMGVLAVSGVLSLDAIGGWDRQIFTTVAPPPLVNQEPQPARPDLELKPLTPTARTPRSDAPALPKIDPPQIQIAERPKSFPLPAAPDRGGKLTPPIKTNVFSSGSSAPQTVDLPARAVQTGGFGDPNGVPPSANSNGTSNIASVGSFDLPRGGGYGNGTGGSHGTPGIVASAGFGNGVAVAGDGTGGRGVVRPGGFADASQPAPAAPRHSRTPEPDATPAEILWKPKPAYTEEARRLHVEGDVVLQVLFAASGEVRVLTVLHGLGHGLDESAIQAAKQIRFKPAQRNNQAVDATGIIHLIFQLT